MVRVLRDNEPIWISKINRRMSFNKFRENASHFRSIGQDFSRVLKYINEVKEVYEVTIETWSKGSMNIWVASNYVETTGEMLEKFLETDQMEESTLMENEVTISDLIEIGTRSDEDGEENDSDNEEEEEKEIDSDLDDSWFSDEA
ncbi:unnamed protein product [Caenorhabditis angaria]|uniref:Uncharacterized protein n=1 Tax=Caenorhabditis angaria TaxID=860376 RepID=A0A9P1IVN6_9PELO|nr:unnamed protein product [Caenorhabditis angaria]